MEASFDSFTGLQAGVVQLRADSVVLGRQRLCSNISAADTANTSASKVQPASLALQDDGDENIVSIGCGWFRWGNCSGGEYDNGGARRSRFRSFVSEPGGGRRPSVTRSGGSGRGGILLRQHPTRREVDSEDDGDNDASTALASLLQTLRRGLASWIPRVRLRLLGSGRGVVVDGVSYPLRTHLRLHKPRRSALRGSVSHLQLCPDGIASVPYGRGSANCSAASHPAVMPISQATSMKRLRFAISVKEAACGDCERAGNDAAEGSGHIAEVPDDSPQSDWARDGPKTSCDGGMEGSSCRDSSESAADGGLVVLEGSQPASASLLEPQATQYSAPPAVTAVTGASSRNGGSFRADSGGGAVPCVTPTAASTGDLAATAAALRSTDRQAVVSATGSQQRPRKLMSKGPYGSGKSQIHPERDPPQKDAIVSSSDFNVVTQSSSVAVMAAVAPQLGSPDGVGGGAMTSLVFRTPSLLARLLGGNRDSVGLTSSGQLPARIPSDVTSASDSGCRSGGGSKPDSVPQGFLATTTTTATASHVLQSPLATQLLIPQPQPPLPGRHSSASQLMQNVIFVPDPSASGAAPFSLRSSNLRGGEARSSVGTFTVQAQRATSYTAPGMLYVDEPPATPTPPPARSTNTPVTASVEMSETVPLGMQRRLFLAVPPSAKSPGGKQQQPLQPLSQQQLQKSSSPLTPKTQSQQQQQRPLQLPQVARHERGDNVESDEDEGHDDDDKDDSDEEDRNEEDTAEERLRLKRAAGGQAGVLAGKAVPELKVAHKEVPDERNTSEGGGIQSSLQWWVTSVRPVDMDVGDDVSGHGTADADVPLNWLEALRKSRSMTETQVSMTRGAHRRAVDRGVGSDGNGAAADDDTDDLMQHLDRGRCGRWEPQQTEAPRLSKAAVAVGRSARPLGSSSSSFGSEKLFSNLSFSVQRAVWAMRDRSPGAIPNEGQLQWQQPQPLLSRNDSSRVSVLTVAKAAAAVGRSRKIRAAPFAAAIGLLNPGNVVTSLTTAAAAPTSRNATAGRWQQQQQQEQQEQQQQQELRPHYSPTRQPASSSRQEEAARSSPHSSYLAATATPSSRGPSACATDHTSFARPRRCGSGSNIHSPLDQSSPPVAEIAAASPTLPFAEERVKQLTGALPGRGRSIGNCELNDEKGVGADAHSVGVVDTSGSLSAPTTTNQLKLKPFAVEEATGISDGGGVEAVKYVFKSPGPGLRGPSLNVSQVFNSTRNRSCNDGSADFNPWVANPWVNPLMDVSLSPLNTPETAGPWVDERCAMALSGTPLGDMTVSLAQALAARLDMTSSGVVVRSGGGGDGHDGGGGNGRSRVAQASHRSRVETSTIAMGSNQQQQQQGKQGQHRQHLQPPGDGSSALLNSPKDSENGRPESRLTMIAPPGASVPSCAASAGAGRATSSGESDGVVVGGYAAAKRQAMNASFTHGQVPFSMDLGGDGGRGLTAAPDSGGNAGGGGGNRGVTSSYGFHLPGGIELVVGAKSSRDGGNGGDGWKGGGGGGGSGDGVNCIAINGITAGSAVLSQKDSLRERTGVTEKGRG